jgi:cathepsin L
VQQSFSFQLPFCRFLHLDPNHQAIFETTLAEIIAHNQDGQWTYKKGVNQFTDMTKAEFKAYYAGYKKVSFLRSLFLDLIQFNSRFLKPKDHLFATDVNAIPDVCGGPKASDAPVDFPLKSALELATDVDWRTHTPAVVTPVKNQGGCGSCWAFSTVETMESNIAMNTGKLLELSPQQVVSCSKNAEHCGGDGGCQGSTSWLGFNYTIGAGITDEKDYPYKATTGTCQSAKIVKAGGGGIAGCVRLPTNNYTVLVNAVATLGPISISAAAEPWQTYERGVYNGRCGTDIDHAIQAVGYGVDTVRGKTSNYWLVRNSWCVHALS